MRNTMQESWVVSRQTVFALGRREPPQAVEAKPAFRLRCHRSGQYQRRSCGTEQPATPYPSTGVLPTLPRPNGLNARLAQTPVRGEAFQVYQHYSACQQLPL